MVRAQRHGQFKQTQKKLRENQRFSMRIDLEVLNSFDLIITTNTKYSEYEETGEKERKIYV